MIPRLNSGCFTWQLWRGGCLCDLGISANIESCIINSKELLLKYAVGWCPAHIIPCRPKENCVAVMFQKGETEFWTHLLNSEFESVFGKSKTP